MNPPSITQVIEMQVATVEIGGPLQPGFDPCTPVRVILKTRDDRGRITYFTDASIAPRVGTRVVVTIQEAE